MDVLAWVTEATWPACVTAMRDHVLPDARVTLLYVADDTIPAAALGAFAGLLGRSAGPGLDPAARARDLAARAGRDLRDAAAREAGREVTLEQRHGRVER